MRAGKRCLITGDFAGVNDIHISDYQAYLPCSIFTVVKYLHLTRHSARIKSEVQHTLFYRMTCRHFFFITNSERAFGDRQRT